MYYGVSLSPQNTVDLITKKYYTTHFPDLQVL